MDLKVLPSILNQVLQIQIDIGKYQLKYFRNPFLGTGGEKTKGEFFSKIDVNSEDMIKEKLINIEPSLGFLGEEKGQSGDKDNFWIVDPIDGTNNYLSGIDQFAISIALQIKGELVLGSVYKPTTGESFTAIRNQGAFYDNQKIKHKLNIHPYKEIKTAMIGTGFPYRSRKVRENFFNCTRAVLKVSRDIRRIGSASLDLSYVAANFFQGFWETDLNSYDVAAALVLLQETHCPFSTFQGEKYDLFKSRTLVTGHKGVYEPLQQITKQFYPSDY